MVNGTLRQQVVRLSQDLHEGETLRTVCPVCNGGSSQEKTFVLTARQHNVLYCCFRGKCGVRGMAFMNTVPGKARPNPIKKYTGELIPVPEEVYLHRYKPYGISQETVAEQGITFANDIGRVRSPIYNHMGYVVGESLRAIGTHQKPKTLINKWNEVPLLHFPLGQTFSESIVLVEDQVSAIKVAQIAYCAALLGTFLSDDCLILLKRLGTKKVILMLDGDAPGIQASRRLVDKLSPFFSVVNIILPQGKDPKDMSLDYLQRRLNDSV